MNGTVWTVLLTGLLTGCVPFAYVLPPLEVAGDVGALGTASHAAVRSSLDVGVRPLSVVPELHHRHEDFALGYGVVLAPSPVQHGPWVEYAHVFFEHDTSEVSLWRLRGGAVARLLYEPSVQRFGAQAALRAVFEFSTFVEGDFSSSDGRGWVTGHAVGEAAVGLYVEAGAVATPMLVGWSASVGLVATLPASAGVGFVWAK